MGAGVADIAAALGVTEGTLRAQCSRAGVSLARRQVTPETGLSLRVWAALQRAADRRGETVPQVISAVLTGVVERDLFAAVLGDVAL